MADQEDQQPSVADMGDLLDAQKYYQQLAQTPSVQQPQQPQQPSDADVNDLQQAANYYQQLGQTPSATAPQQPATSDVDDLKAAAGYYGMLDQAPLTPEIAAKQKEEEPKDDGDRRIAGTSAKYNTKDEEASKGGGYGAIDYEGAGYQPMGGLSPEEAHGVENARRIQAGLPTIEEEKIHTGRLNALRQAKGLPTIEEEDTKRLKAGKKTVEEEDALKKQHAAGTTHMILAANDAIPAGAAAGPMGAAGGLLGVPNPLSVIGGPISGAPLPQNAPPRQQTQGAAPSWVQNYYGQKPADPTLDYDLGATAPPTSTNNAPAPVPLSGAPGSHTQAGAPPSYLAAQNAPPDLHRAAPTGTGAAPVAGGPLNIPPSRVVGGGWQSTLAPDAQDERRAYQMAQGRNLWANNSDAQDIVRQTQEAAAKRTGELQAQVKHDQFEHQLASIAQEKAQDVYESAQREAANAKVDPDKIYGKDGSGRIFAALGAALGAVGATLGHTQNFALEMVKDQVNASLEAQKAELVGKEKVANNAYSRLLGATGDERAADAAFKSSGLEVAASQALELDSGIKGQELAMSLRNGQADLLRQHYLDTVATERQVAGQTVGIDTKRANARVAELRDKAAADGHELTPTEAWRQAVEEQRPGSQSGGFQPIAKPAAGAGSRAAATASHYENMINEANTGLSAVQELQNIVARGGQNSPSLRKHVTDLIERSISSQAAVLQNGQTPTTESRAAARAQHPDMPSRTEWTDEDKTSLNDLENFYKEKLRQAKGTKTQLGDAPWETKPSDDENAAAAGATER